jgi:translation initiation factor 1
MNHLKTKGLVYSTEMGKTCQGCGHPFKQCCCSAGKGQEKGDGVVRVRRQTKGRKGNGVCIITGLPLGDEALKKLACQLKKKCGAGGTIKDGVIEIQGDHREVLVDALLRLGYKAKPAGG